jgi:hypothetical protein
VLLNPNPLRSSAIEDGSDRHNLTSQKDNLCHLRAVVSPIASHPASLSSSERYGVRKRRYAEKSMESLKSLPNKGPPKLSGKERQDKRPKFTEIEYRKPIYILLVFPGQNLNFAPQVIHS